jgi:translation initiation factor IF-3
VFSIVLNYDEYIYLEKKYKKIKNKQNQKNQKIKKIKIEIN